MFRFIAEEAKVVVDLDEKVRKVQYLVSGIEEPELSSEKFKEELLANILKREPIDRSKIHYIGYQSNYTFLVVREIESESKRFGMIAQFRSWEEFLEKEYLHNDLSRSQGLGIDHYLFRRLVKDIVWQSEKTQGGHNVPIDLKPALNQDYDKINKSDFIKFLKQEIAIITSENFITNEDLARYLESFKTRWMNGY